MTINVQMLETNQSFTSQFIYDNCDFKVDFSTDDMLIPTIFNEEVS